MAGSKTGQSVRDLLFWSGGKDAFLALLYYRDQFKTDPALLTTYDEEREMVPHQEIPLPAIFRQAVALGLPLIPVPLAHPASNEVYLQAVETAIRTSPFRIQRLIFGDLHLQDIREWREQQFETMGFECLFPIWEKPYDELFDRLFSEPVSVRVQSVAEAYSDHLSVGDTLTRAYLERLPDSIDRMGERGEFHTEVIF
ncbi:MAG: ATP-binding protein [Balneolaceae bacterium]